MNAVMESVGTVGKDSRNAQQNYDFRSLEAVVQALAKPMATNGLTLIPSFGEPTFEKVKSRGGSEGYRCVIKGTFTITDGSESLPIVTYGEAIDYGDKSTNKAMSAALKYALVQAFMLGGTGEDPDAQSHDLGVGGAPRKTEAPKATNAAKTKLLDNLAGDKQAAAAAWAAAMAEVGLTPDAACETPEQAEEVFRRALDLGEEALDQADAEADDEEQ